MALAMRQKVICTIEAVRGAVVKRIPHVKVTVLNAFIPGLRPAPGRPFLHFIPPLSASPFPVYLTMCYQVKVKNPINIFFKNSNI